VIRESNLLPGNRGCSQGSVAITNIAEITSYSLLGQLNKMAHAKQKTDVLPRSFYESSPEVVARALLGKILVHHREGERLSGRIVENEAYLGLSDPASHAFTGRSPYNDVLFGPPGYTDVYLIYGLHYCLNVSCLPDGEAGGVLIRALDPIEGIEAMRRLRGLNETASATQLTGGPGRLCQALGIKRATHHGIDVTGSKSVLQIVDDGYRPETVGVTSRIGIRKAADRPLRFIIGSHFEGST
jgi:DNA-3-methyladenine glycosylase